MVAFWPFFLLFGFKLVQRDIMCKIELNHTRKAYIMDYYDFACILKFDTHLKTPYPLVKDILFKIVVSFA